MKVYRNQPDFSRPCGCVPCAPCSPGPCPVTGPTGPTGPTGATGAAGPGGPIGATGIAETIVIQTTQTVAPETPALVVDVTGGPNHVLDFIIPRGASGPTGPTGTAATVTIGSVTTGDPGTDAEVTNSGTGENAIFDFVIPRGGPGTEGSPEVLTTVDSTRQSPTANTALVFNQNPLVSGSALTHAPGSAEVNIMEPGIYQAIFQSDVSVNTGTTIPSAFTVRLNENSTQVPGGIATHAFTSTDEIANLAFSVPFAVTAVTTIIQVIAEQEGYTFENLALTIIRLGNTTTLITG